MGKTKTATGARSHSCALHLRLNAYQCILSVLSALHTLLLSKHSVLCVPPEATIKRAEPENHIEEEGECITASVRVFQSPDDAAECRCWFSSAVCKVVCKAHIMVRLLSVMSQEVAPLGARCCTTRFTMCCNVKHVWIVVLTRGMRVVGYRSRGRWTQQEGQADSAKE